MTISILSDILTISTGIKLGAGALLHRIGQAIIAKLRAAEADAKKIVADVKKDI